MCKPLCAQQFLWDIDFRFRFDNREYRGTLTHPTTLFGTKLTPEVGLQWDNKTRGSNALMLGGDFTFNFGQKQFSILPNLLLYYQYRSPKFKAYAGFLPRKHMMGDYSNAFFNDSIQFYDGTIEGLLLNYSDRLGYIEVGCDWNSMYSQENREKFMLFSSGCFTYQWFNMGYALQVYHFAGSYTEKGVVDNLLVSPYLRFDVSSITPLDTLYLKAAYLQGYQWERTAGPSARLYPHGGQIDFGIEKWGMGIRNECYFGQNLMPLFARYAHTLYWGEDYYQASRIYNRLEVYYHPIHSGDLDLKISSIHHFEGEHWGWQQVVSLGIHLDNSFIKKVRNKGFKRKKLEHEIQ